MRLRADFPFFSILLIVVAIYGCAKKEEMKPAATAPLSEAAQEGKNLVEELCVVCHSLERVMSRTETKEKWASIIKEMQGKRPGFISDADAVKILAYLSSKYGQ